MFLQYTTCPVSDSVILKKEHTGAACGYREVIFSTTTGFIDRYRNPPRLGESYLEIIKPDSQPFVSYLLRSMTSSMIHLLESHPLISLHLLWKCVSRVYLLDMARDDAVHIAALS